METHDESVIVIDVVHLPGQHQLLAIAHTHDALSFGLRLGQCGQQHARQNGNNGDDDKKFD